MNGMSTHHAMSTLDCDTTVDTSVDKKMAELRAPQAMSTLSTLLFSIKPKEKKERPPKGTHAREGTVDMTTTEAGLC